MNRKNTNNPTYIVLGSGGHTAEMCKLNKALLKNNVNNEFGKIRYIIANTDKISIDKLKTSMNASNLNVADKDITFIPRSREVGQNWFSTIFQTIYAFFICLYIVIKDRPRLILCNGPGTCVPVCVAAYFCRIIHLLPVKTKIVFIESVCRVKSLSLSGRLLLPLVDLLIVQWPKLAESYKTKDHVKYFGSIML